MTDKKPFLVRFVKVPIGEGLTPRSDKRDSKSDPSVSFKETPRPRPTRITMVGGETTDDD